MENVSPEASRMAKAYAEGLQEGEGLSGGGREGGNCRGKRVRGRGGRQTDTEENIDNIGESIPDGWRPEASPPAGRSPEAKASVEARGLPFRRAKLCLCLSLTQTLSHTQKGGETETGAHTAKPTTRSAVERRASIYSQRCPPRSIP